LRAERTQTFDRFGSRASMPCGGKLGVETPKHFVALGSFGVRQSEYAPWAHERDAGPLGLVPRVMLPLPYAFGDTLSCKVCAVVELECGRHL
jgi:hypothetical protein